MQSGAQSARRHLCVTLALKNIEKRLFYMVWSVFGGPFFGDHFLAGTLPCSEALVLFGAEALSCSAALVLGS